MPIIFNNALAETKYKVGIYNEYIPFTIHNSDNSFVGIDVDVLNKIAEKLGISVEYVGMSWDNLFDEFSKNNIDIAVGGFSISDAEDHQIQTNVYSENYMKSNDCYAFLTDKRKVNFDKSSFGIESSSSVLKDDLIEKFDLNPDQFTDFNDIDLIMQALLGGKIDVAVGDCAAEKYIVSRLADKRKIAITEIPKMDKEDSAYLIFLVKKEHVGLKEKIDTTLKEMKQNGELHTIVEKSQNSNLSCVILHLSL